MTLGFNSYELIVAFDESKFEGQTIHFFGERSADEKFLAYTLFVHQIKPTSIKQIGHEHRVHIREISGDELTKMIQAITAYCATQRLKVVFEESTEPVLSKVKLIGLYGGSILFSFEEEELAGQTILFSTNYLKNRDLNINPFGAKQIEPIAPEDFYRVGRKDVVIRDVPRNELPAIIQAIKSYRATEAFPAEYKEKHRELYRYMTGGDATNMFKPFNECYDDNETIRFFGE